MTGQAVAGGRRGSRLRIALWGMAAALLALPAVAMRFTDDVDWTASDFVFAGVLFGLVGLGLELAVRASRDWAWRGGAALAILSCFALVWVNGAVGMIGDEDNGYNLLFLGLIPLALLGALVARFRAAGMAVAMTAAAAAQVLIAAGGLSADARGAVLSMVMAGSWLLSAALFRIAARRDRLEGAAAS